MESSVIPVFPGEESVNLFRKPEYQIHMSSGSTLEASALEALTTSMNFGNYKLLLRNLGSFSLLLLLVPNQESEHDLSRYRRPR